MKTTRYRIQATASVSFKAAIVADLHDRAYDGILPILERESPDLILIPGDLTESPLKGLDPQAHPGLRLLSACTAMAPTFYSLGNHEIGGVHSRIHRAKLMGQGAPAPIDLPESWLDLIRESGAILLDEDFVTWQGAHTGDLVIGGLGSALLNPGWTPDLGWLDRYTQTPGYKLLLCHHPEYFDRYLRPYDIQMIVSGHAHGGQWRIFGRGVYAPDQHLFPKYTSGVHEERLIISRGVSNTVPFAPRFFNRREVVIVECQ